MRNFLILLALQGLTSCRIESDAAHLADDATQNKPAVREPIAAPIPADVVKALNATAQKEGPKFIAPADIDKPDPTKIVIDANPMASAYATASLEKVTTDKLLASLKWGTSAKFAGRYTEVPSFGFELSVTRKDAETYTVIGGFKNGAIAFAQRDLDVKTSKLAPDQYFQIIFLPDARTNSKLEVWLAKIVEGELWGTSVDQDQKPDAIKDIKWLKPGDFLEQLKKSQAARSGS